MVELLVTMDLEVAEDHDLDDQAKILDRLRSDLASLGLPITLFTVANAARRFRHPLQGLHADGHEIGCHGLDHAAEENYRLLGAEAARQRLRRATDEIHASIGERPRVFRGPYMATSCATQSALIELEYEADCSVCPQRLDFALTRGGSAGWLTAPRVPYSPSERSPHRRGDRPLRVVPLSCLGAPFISGLLYLAGLPGVTAFYRTLLAEARRTGAPLVFLFHSYEFARFTGEQRDARPWLHRRYLRDPEERYQLNLELLQRMLLEPGLHPSTVSTWLRNHGGSQ
jgi:hypothetical protein